MSKTQTFAFADVEKHNAPGDCWMVIHNRVYDVSKWNKHPGGDFIQQGWGRDATALYESTHPGTAADILKKFYIGELRNEDRNEKYTWDSEFYKTLRSRVDAWFKERNITNRQDHWELWMKLIVVTVGFPVFYYIALTTQNMLVRYSSLLLSTVFLAHWGISVMHDGCHGSWSKNPVMSKLAAYYLDFIGASSFVWMHQHNIGHHAHTNTEDDPDAITAHPMLRVSPHREWKPWMQFQQYYAWVLFAFVALRWMAKDIEVLIAGKYEDIPLMRMDNTQKGIFIASKIWFLFLYFFVPFYFLGLREGLIFFFVIEISTSEQFALHFTVNHYEDPLIFPTSKFPETD